MRRILLATTALAISTMSAPAFAQDAGDDDGIQEILVTAQKKEESLQKAAIAIDAVSGSELIQQGVTNALDIGKVSPAVNFSNGGGTNTSIFMRGVGAITNNNYLDPAVTPSYDGVVLGRGSGAFSAGFYDLARVEVLKGPQGILYGRNATGGAVNIIPNKPKLGETGAGFNVSFGNYDAVNAEGYLNLATGETSALRVSAMRQVHDGYNRDGSDDLDRSGVRGQFLFQPSDGLSVKLGADWTKLKGNGAGATYVGNFLPGPAGYTFLPAAFDDSEGLNTAAANAYRTTALGAPGFGFLTPLNHEQFLDFTYWGVNAEIGIDTGVGKITIIPAYRRSKGETFFYGPAFNSAYNKESIKQTSLEARLDGSASIIDYVIGGYYFKENIHNNNEYNQEFVLPIQAYDTGTKSFALFGQLTANLSDRLRLKGGARYTKDKKFMDGIINNFVTFCGGLPPANLVPPASFGGGCAAPNSLPRYPNFLSVADTVNWLKSNGWINGATTVQDNTQVFPLLNGRGTILKSHSPVSDGGSFDRVTWKLSGEFDVAPDSLLYATAESGYRAGGFQLAEGNPQYAPEYITAYSIGSKNRFFGNKLQLNAEAFLWKYKDQQISYFSLDFASGVLINRTANAGRATIKGFDVDVIAKPLSNTTLSLQAQYLKTKYTDLHLYTAAPRDNINCPSSIMMSGGAPIIVGGAPAKDFNCTGNPLLFSPKWTVNMGLEQVIPLGDLELVGSARTSWRAKQWGSFEYLVHQLIPSYWLSDLSLTLRQADKGWGVSGFINNVEGNRHSTRPQASPLGFATTTYSAPRTYGIRVSADF